MLTYYNSMVAFHIERTCFHTEYSNYGLKRRRQEVPRYLNHQSKVAKFGKEGLPSHPAPSRKGVRVPFEDRELMILS